MSLIHKAGVVTVLQSAAAVVQNFVAARTATVHEGVRLNCFYCGSTDPFDHICDPDPKNFVRGHTRWLQPPIFAEIRYCQACGCQLDMCSDECINCGNIE